MGRQNSADVSGEVTTKCSTLQATNPFPKGRNRVWPLRDKGISQGEMLMFDTHTYPCANASVILTVRFVHSRQSQAKQQARYYSQVFVELWLLSNSESETWTSCLCVSCALPTLSPTEFKFGSLHPGSSLWLWLPKRHC